MKELKKRKTTRLKGADYNHNCTVFLTICTKDRACILSRIVGTGVLDGPKKGSVDAFGASDSPQMSVLEGCKVELTEYGLIADKYIKQLNDFYDDLSIESYVIMPNHIHIMLTANGDSDIRDETPENGPSGTPKNGPSGTPVPTGVSVQNTVTARFLSTFKRFCNKECGMNIWQYRSYDHIIHNRKDYEAHLGYIYENPMNWYADELYIE